MRIINICIALMFIFVNKINAQTECATIVGSTISSTIFYKTGIEKFPISTQKSIRRVTTFFNVNITFILATDYNGICHNYISANKGEVTIGQDFLNRFKDDPLFIEVLIAHEIGHTLYHTYKSLYYSQLYTNYGKAYLENKYAEMQADVVAGYYLGHWLATKMKSTPNTTQKELYSSMAGDVVIKFKEIADIDFENSKHHGDFIDRTDSVIKGLNLFVGVKDVFNYKFKGDFRKLSSSKVNSNSKLYYYSFVEIIKANKETGSGIKIE